MQPTTETPKIAVEGIAIVGIGCVLPGGISSADSLWHFLCEAKDAVTEVPPSRWNIDAVYSPDPRVPGRTVTRWGGFVEDIAAFDAAFFGISPREAAVIDPQQRLLLQTAWRALEDAGIPLEQIAGSNTGVYIGISHSDYQGIQQFGRYEIDVHTITGGALSIAANRISHRFDLKGPSLAVDTACSSSLVALDLACRTLSRGECKMALVGGANAMLTPDVTITFSRASMLSPDGRCKAFDARANGYVRGEGAGVVVLKPLAQAVTDGDKIYAVIRATAVNQDGLTSTMTVPSLTAQVDMLRDACRKASIEPSQVSYVEAHGTGTPVGDPIEAEAIGTVFGEHGSRACLIGSIKTNIGHLEPAAGIAGLIKAALCVERGYIPPSIHFETLNPNIRASEWGIEVCRRLTAFPSSAGTRLAAVNSFGFGGTNACAVLQQPPSPLARNTEHRNDRYPLLLPISSSSDKFLRTNAVELANFLETGSAGLPDVAGTLGSRKTHFDHRAVVITTTAEDAATGLRTFADGLTIPNVVVGRRGGAARIAFVFTGQGAQRWAMGRHLLDNDQIFAAAVAECDAIFKRLAGWSIVDELRCEQAYSRMEQTVVAQPATFALQIGLAARWKAWGVKPEAVIGHSIGEMAAACVAKTLSLKEAVSVVFHRSRLQEHARFQGGMAAVGLSVDDANELLLKEGLDLEVAAINAPELVTLGGPCDEIDRLLAILSEANTFGRRLQIDYAFHTRQMDPFGEELRFNLSDIAPRSGDVPMYSTVTGRIVSPRELDADYWWRNMREPVRFHAAVDAAAADGLNTFIELGAHPVLVGPIRECLAARARNGVVVTSLDRSELDEVAMLRSLAELHCSGVPLDWSAVSPSEWQFRRLPIQPLATTQFWVESEASRAARLEGPTHPLLGYRSRSSAPRWQTQVGSTFPTFLGDHRIDGSVVFPAAGYVELMLAAAREVLGEAPWELESIVFHDALILSTETVTVLETLLDQAHQRIEICSRVRGGEWILRASARLRAWRGPAPQLEAWRPKIDPPASLEHDRFYRMLRTEGHIYGPTFRSVKTIWHEGGEALGLLKLPTEIGTADNYLLHPSLLDGCIQLIRAFKRTDDEYADGTLALPVQIERMRFFRRPGTTIFGRATAIKETPSEIISNITILDEVGRTVALIEKLKCQRLYRSNQERDLTGPTFYRENWIASANTSPIASASRQVWLLLADRSGLAERLVALIRESGGRAILAGPGEVFRTYTEDSFDCTPGVAGFQTLLQEIAGPIDHIIDFWPLLSASHGESCDPRAASIWGLEALISLTQCIGSLPWRPRISVLTAGAVITPNEQVTSIAATIAHAGILGAIRTIRNEYFGLTIRSIDIDAPDFDSEQLFAEICSDTAENEIVLHGGQRLVGRLERIAADALPLRRTPWLKDTHVPRFHVTMTAPGVIDNLVLRQMPTAELAPHQVMIEVHAVGLNFRDIMAATGLLPPEAEDQPAWQRLGFEAAGVVCAVGENVDPALIGRRVVAMSIGCLASHAIASDLLVFPISNELPFEIAAALPTAYVTARYALVTLARLHAGETVLIHAATGGVGLAAIAIARQKGADVIATAGSPAKRDYLRKLGIRHIFDSRSLSFADDVVKATQGRGVDLILNSLPGQFIDKSLSLLASGGRFLELGKRDVYADTPIGLRSLRKNISFCAIDLARLASERPDIVKQEADAIFDELNSGRLSLLPVERFELSDTAVAFRHMAQARHVGKVVVSLDAPAQIELIGSEDIIRSDATYLITGGTGGLGLAIAEWMIGQGARNLIMLGRCGDSRPETITALERMKAGGAHIATIAENVANREALQDALASILQSAPPLAGVFHAAGVIDDAMVSNLDLARIRRVIDPKTTGAWNLHELTLKMPLDFFVCISSVSATLGAVGQAHYAAANRSLDVLMSARRAAGLPGLSIACGPVSDVGHLVRHPDVARHLDAMGVRPMNLQNTLAGIKTAMAHECEAIVFADLYWPAIARANPALCAQPRLSAHVASHAGAVHSGHFRTHLLELSEGAREVKLIDFLRDQIGTVLKLQVQSIDPDRPVSELGLDSLTSFELKNRVESALGISLPLGSFLQRPSVNKLVALIAQKLIDAETSVIDSNATDGLDSEPTISIGQEALWYIDHFVPGSPAYALAMCVAVRPALNPELVDAAFRRLVARHDSLRLSFPADALGPVPTFLDQSQFVLARHDFEHSDEGTFRSALDREGNRPFDLGDGPLIRLHFFHRSDRDVLLLQVHHIVADAASIVICLGEMFETYFALQTAGAIRHTRATLSATAFASWQRRMVDGPEGRAHAAYWRKQLEELPSPLSLPTDLPRPASQRGPGSSRNIIIPVELGAKLKQLAAQKSQTLFAVLLTSFNVLLHRLSGDTDIVVGTPTLGRVRPDFAEAVGYLVNPVPIRTHLDTAENFDALLMQVGATIRSALEHQEYPFSLIVRDLDLPRESSRSPIFQVLFAMERPAEVDAKGFAATLLNIEGTQIELRGLNVESMPIKRDRAQFDLTFVMEEFEDRIIGVVDYRTDLWETATIDRFVENFTTILETIVERPAAAITELAVEKSHNVLVGPLVPEYPDVIDSIRAVAAARPTRIAVECSGKSWTYRQLMDRSTAIALALKSFGISRQALVGVCVTRSSDLIAALLGVWEIEAAYVPLDVTHPAARLICILADTTPSIIVADGASAVTLSQITDCPIITLDEISHSPDVVHFGKRTRNPSDLAYVIHTSGSTGGPLGVEVRRDGISNFLAAMALELPVSGDDVLLAVTTVGFDIAVLELIFPLTLGGRIVVAADDVARDGRRLRARLSQGDITIMQGTPATWHLLINAGWIGHHTFKALVGGEQLHRTLADELLRRVGGLWNLYGPTETTVWSTCAQVFSGSASVPIGNPIANTRCHVVDHRMQDVPSGMLGELLIAGPGVARGYRNQPELTKSRFIPDPFDPAGGSLCFRTGDVVRLSESGLLFGGRRDHQIKIRGYRVELGEIEAALRGHPAVDEVAVLLQTDNIERAWISAFAVLRSGHSADSNTLSAHLKRLLPSYMLPTSIGIIPTMPRLPNGKIDRVHLKALAQSNHSRPKSKKPRNPTEQRLAAVLSEILEIQDCGVEDDFFAVGGTSLLGMRYLARISDAFHVDLGPVDLLSAPTIADMAALISNRRANSATADSTDAISIVPNIPAKWRPLPLARAEGVFDEIDGAAIAYLPDELARLTALHARLMSQQNGEPYWIGVCKLSLGTIALIVAPLSGRDLFADSAITKATLNRAIERAARLGARSVALTGLIPAATDLGLALRAPEGVTLTHGQASTAAAMALTVAGVMRATERTLQNEMLCFVGLGGMGTATLRTLLTSLDHPRSLILCDVPAKRSYLEALAHEIRVSLGFRGEIDVATQSGELPNKAYQATLFIGATNVPNVIDIERLLPGSIIVDDSFPLCFDSAAALRRFSSSGDVLCVEGGSVCLREQFKWEFALPPGIPSFLQERHAPSLLPPSKFITGCILSSILPNAAEVRATLGPLGTVDCSAYWEAFARLGIESAPLHCGSWSPDRSAIIKFRSLTTRPSRPLLAPGAGE